MILFTPIYGTHTTVDRPCFCLHTHTHTHFCALLICVFQNRSWNGSNESFLLVWGGGGGGGGGNYDYGNATKQTHVHDFFSPLTNNVYCG